MALPARNHRIALADAAAHTKRHRDAKVSEINSHAFHKDQVMELLNQKGCVGLRIYHGRDEKGKPSIVLAGIDQADNDMHAGVLLEVAFPCPPLCPAPNPLTA